MDKINILVIIDSLLDEKQELSMVKLLNNHLITALYIFYINGIPTPESNNQIRDFLECPKNSSLLHFLPDSNESFAKIAAEVQADMVITSYEPTLQYSNIFQNRRLNESMASLKVPMIHLKHEYSARPIKNILLVADFEYFGPGIQIGLIKKIASAFDSTIHLLQMIDKENRQHIDMVTEQMKFFAEEHALEKYDISVYSSSWDKITGQINFNNWDTQMDLICIRSDRRKDFDDLLFGSLAKSLIVDHAKPLLTFKLKQYA